MRGFPHLTAVFVSVTVALTLAWIPYNLWLLIAAMLAMITGRSLRNAWRPGNESSNYLDRYRISGHRDFPDSIIFLGHSGRPKFTGLSPASSSLRTCCRIAGLDTPMVVWPDATDGVLDLVRLSAAASALLIGALFRTTLEAIFGGMAALYLVQYFYT